jgi:hypothetical protein
MIALLLMAFSVARAETPDQEYLRIYGIIQQADSLNTRGDSAGALAKYKEAQTALYQFRRTYPEWDRKTVAFRINYLGDKIDVLTTKTAGADKASGASAAPGEKPSEASSATGSATTQVRLIEAGAEPRQQLRIHAKAGDKQSLTTAIKMDMEMNMAGVDTPAMKMPGMKLVIDATIKSIAENGDLDYDLVASDASVADDPDVMPQIADAVKTSFATMKGTTASATMSSRGIVKVLKLTTAAKSDPQTANSLDQLKETFNNLALPLPEEAIGPGAKWEGKSKVQSQGMTIDQVATYELVSVDGQLATIKADIAQSAPKQKMQSPSMPGMTVDLTKMSGKATGESKLDLTKPFLVEGHGVMHSEINMSANLGGQDQKMAMKLNVEARHTSN